jgi:hypothetical protein
LALLTAGCNALLLHLLYGPELAGVPDDWLSLTGAWLCLTVGCAWAGVLAAGVFRSTTAGLAVVLAVPVAVVPVVHRALAVPSVRTDAGFSARLRELALMRWPLGIGRCGTAVAEMVMQPVGGALMLSLIALFCAFVSMRFHHRAR